MKHRKKEKKNLIQNKSFNTKSTQKLKLSSIICIYNENSARDL